MPLGSSARNPPRDPTEEGALRAWWQLLVVDRALTLLGGAVLLAAIAPTWPGYVAAVVRGTTTSVSFELSLLERGLLSAFGLSLAGYGLFRELKRGTSASPEPNRTAPRDLARRLGLPASAVLDLGRLHADRRLALAQHREQHRIYLAITAATGGIRQDVLEPTVGYADRRAELYYRLEVLRLLGLIEREPDPSARRGDRPLYWYRAHDGSEPIAPAPTAGE